ncbi:C4-dicarboxylate ABC transporter [Sporosarcina ureilytica]|uniref:C4-dicarboxylate ABC transporter n=2 Tax=Sporosarcina ureilytica TaxID=298596 RepID=A0A1D8JKP0_9BACL|nr:C4-dicarboxylate ABC transporter [Sporosarcina ureilytica]
MFVAVFALAACGNSDETITLKLADNHPEDYPTVIGDKKFAELVEEKTNGRYKIDVYAGGQLGDEKSVVEQLQLGSIDLTRVNATPLTEFSEDIGVLSLPYLFKDEESKWEHLNGEIGQELLDSFEGTNLVGLAFYDSGERSIYNSKRLVKTPEDMKGLKIRVQPSELAVNIFESFGSSATPMEYGEVYSAIQTGVIDGAENNLPSYYTSNHYEVAKYLTINKYSGPPEILMASQSLWDKLSEEDKKAFKEAALESVEYQREAWAKLVEESKEAVIENGNEIFEVTDFAPWRKAVEPIYEKHGEKYKKWLDKLEQ